MTIQERFEADNSPRLQRFSTLISAWQKEDEAFHEIAEHDYGNYIDQSRKLMDRLFEDEKGITLKYDGFDIEAFRGLEFSSFAGDNNCNVAIYILKTDWIELTCSDLEEYLDSFGGLCHQLFWNIVTTRLPLDAIGVVEIVY